MFWHSVCLAIQTTVMPVFIVHFWWMQQDIPHTRLVIFIWVNPITAQTL